MFKSAAVALAMAGAATAYTGQSAIYPDPTHVGPFITIPPVTTPLYSSTVTHMTTYYPSKTDDYGAISTHKVTSTRHFDPSTYNPGPSDACHGGVINFQAAGDVEGMPQVGMAIAKAAAIAGVDYHDFTVYEAKYDSSILGTWITTLFCKKETSDKVVSSMHAAPALWSMGLGGNYHQIVYPDAASQDLYVNCNCSKTPSKFLYRGKCVACTPLLSTQKCATGEIVKCTNFSDSHCATA